MVPHMAVVTPALVYPLSRRHGCKFPILLARKISPAALVVKEPAPAFAFEDAALIEVGPAPEKNNYQTQKNHKAILKFAHRPIQREMH